MKNSFIKGISIVEIIIAAGIIAVSVIGIAGAIQVYLKIVYQNARETQAVLLLDETAEAVQHLRDVSFETYVADRDPDQEYTLYWNGFGYALATSTLVLPYEMTRTIMFADVSRDGSDQIVQNGGTIDSDTKKVSITIRWPYKNETKSIVSEMLIHNMYEN